MHPHHNVVAEREITIKLKISGESYAAINEAFAQADAIVQALSHRRYFVVQRHGTYNERAYVLESSIRESRKSSS